MSGDAEETDPDTQICQRLLDVIDNVNNRDRRRKLQLYRTARKK
jgi:hypothetical protein